MGYLKHSFGYKTSRIGSTIIITVKTMMLPEEQEKLEDALADFISEQGLSAIIDNLGTGNSVTVTGKGA